MEHSLANSNIIIVPLENISLLSTACHLRPESSSRKDWTFNIQSRLISQASGPIFKILVHQSVSYDGVGTKGNYAKYKFDVDCIKFNTFDPQ